MNWALQYKKAFINDIKRLDAPVQKRILKAIQDKLQQQPLVFSKPLLENLSGIRQYREGPYRIFFTLEAENIIFIGVLHRSIAHRVIEKRMKQ